MVILLASFASILAWLQLIITLITLSRKNPQGGASQAPKAHDVVVVIPVYNEARIIEYTLKRWYSCSPKPDKILVVDDGSVDNTAAIVYSLAARFPGLSLEILSHCGKAKALNKVLRRINKRIVVVSDADVAPAPNVLCELLAPFSQPNVVAVSANRRTSGPLVVRWFLDIEHAIGANLTRHLGNIWHTQTGMSGALSAFRTSSLNAVAGYPECELSEDTALALEIQRVGRVVYSPTAVAYTTVLLANGSMIERHRRWLIGSMQAIIPRGIRELRDRHKPPLGTLYFVVFRLVLSLCAPFSEYYGLSLVLEGQIQLAIISLLAFWVPSFLTGAIALRLDGYDWKFLVVLPFVQLVVRHYSLLLVGYTFVASIFRLPIRWR